jgi:hypothetical protein
MPLCDLPGGARLERKIEGVHPAHRDVRSVLKWVEALAADADHAIALVTAVTKGPSLVTEGVRAKLCKLVEADCVMDVVSLPERRQRSVWPGVGCFHPKA